MWLLGALHWFGVDAAQFWRLWLDAGIIMVYSRLTLGSRVETGFGPVQGQLLASGLLRFSPVMANEWPLSDNLIWTAHRPSFLLYLAWRKMGCVGRSRARQNVLMCVVPKGFRLLNGMDAKKQLRLVAGATNVVKFYNFLRLIDVFHKCFPHFPETGFP